MSQLGPKVTFSDKFSDTLSGVRSLLDSASLVLTIDNSLPSDVRMRHHFCRFGAAGRRGFLNCRCRITDYLAALCLIMFTSNFVKCLCVVIHDSITIICASLTIIILIVNYCKTTIVRHRLIHWFIDLLIDWTCQCSEKVMEFTPKRDGRPGYTGGWSVGQSVVSNLLRYSGAQVHLGDAHSSSGQH